MKTPSPPEKQRSYLLFSRFICRNAKSPCSASRLKERFMNFDVPEPTGIALLGFSTFFFLGSHHYGRRNKASLPCDDRYGHLAEVAAFFAWNARI